MKTKAKEVMKRPDYVGTLRRIAVGETQVFKMLGTTYNSMLTARGRLQANREGVWHFEVDAAANEMRITRFALPVRLAANDVKFSNEALP